MRSFFLVIEATESQTTGIADLLQQAVSQVAVAHTKVEALELLEGSHRFTGVVIDAMLPDGSALDVLKCMRDRGIHTPTLVVAHPDEVKTWVEAQCHGAFTLPRPTSHESLAAFVHFAKRHRATALAFLDEEVRALGQRYGLTAREREIVRLAASGVARHELMTVLRVEENTIKTTVRRLLRKARKSALSEIVSEVHRAIFAARTRDSIPAPPL